MTTPAPTPQATPSGPLGSLSAQLSAELAAKPASTAATDLYGLGEWGTQTIDPGDLPILVNLLGTGQKTTGNAIVAAFANAGQKNDQIDVGNVGAIQRALLLGGYYSSTYTPTYGVVKPADITAFGHAVTVAGQSKAPVSDVLLSGAQYGTAAGVAAARQQNAPAKVATVTLPNTQTLEAEAVKAFQEVLGRKATPSEAAAFAASYRAMSAGQQRAANQAAYDAETASSGGLTASQANSFETQAGEVGEAPVPGSSTTAENDFPWTGATPGSATAAENDQQQGLLTDQQLGVPDFSSELGALGDIAQQVQAQAVPGGAPTGLTQVDQTSPEDPTVAAENFAENADPKAAAGTDLAGQFHNLLSILGSSTGGA